MSLGEATPKVTNNNNNTTTPAPVSVSSNMIRKINFRTRLVSLLDQFTTILTIKADNVGSKQLQIVRKALRGQAEILMGKNTMIRKVLRQNGERYPNIEGLLPFIQGNTGLVFTNRDIREIKSLLVANKVRCSAKVGALSPVDVSISAGNTGLEPSKTSFFQALGIPSRINKGSISLDNSVLVVKAGQRVTHSQATLLQMLNVKPFEYGLKVDMIYDRGEVYPSSVPEAVEFNFLNNLRAAFTNIAAVNSEAGLPDLPASILRFLQGGSSSSSGNAGPLSPHGDPPSADREVDEPVDKDFDDFGGIFGDEDEDNDDDDGGAAASRIKDQREEPSMGSLFGDDDDEEYENDSASKKKQDDDDQEEETQGVGMGSLFGGDDEEY